MKSFLVSVLVLVLLSFKAHGATYDIDDIQVLGLQRVSADSVFAAIDVRANTQVTDVQIQQVIRDLYATGYFEKVTVGREGAVLIISVDERPVISAIVLEGNKIIEKEALLDGLKAIGLAEGELFKASALNDIEKQLNAQYSALGRYAAEIEVLTKSVGQNQVVIGLRIDEGQVAKIKHINIVGNTKFAENELRDLFDLNTTGTWSWLTGSDKYAREKLAGDIEKLKSFYLDRGYLKFSVTSTQVSLSPDKETVFITVNIDEGEQFKVANITIEGDPVIAEDELQSLIPIKIGDIYSQLVVTQTEQAIIKRLANDGYSGAQVNGAPQFNDEQQVDLAFYIKPGEISYVRRIAFTGNSATADYVLRREMRQLEGAPISAEKLEQSRLRLQRLGLFGDVKLVTKDVPGTTDQIDVEFQVTEQPTASVNFNLGYSSGRGISIGAGLQHNNWLGTGNTLGFNVEKSDIETNYSFNYSNPYFTRDGVSRSISLFYRARDFDDISVTNYSADTVGMKVNFGYPISETGRLSFGVGFENVTIEPGRVTAQEIQGTPILIEDSDLQQSYIAESIYDDIVTNAFDGDIDNVDTNNNGIIDEDDNITASNADLDELIVASADVTPFADNSPVVADRPEGFLDKYGDTFDTLSLTLGWSDSALDRAIFPTRGISQRFDAEVAVPVGDLQFYKLTYRNDIYFPLAKSTALHFRSRFGYGDVYGDIETYPFFENFFAGGVGSVRGFESSSLGPKGTPANAYITVPIAQDGTAPVAEGDLEFVYVLDADTGQLKTGDIGELNTIGGNILVELSMELVFPMPFVKSSDKTRLALFVDSGNVFSSNCGASQENCGDIDFNKLSVAAGIGIQWLSPVGPISFNFSKPIREQPFDESETFQFSLGRLF